jgi:GNAT superfamily N-acetyltransferase
MFNKEDDDVYAIEFWRNNSQDATGDGDSQKVFATVLSAIQEFLTTKAQPRFISFTGAKGEDDEGKDSRVSLYSKLLQRYATSWGYKLKNVFDRADAVVFDLVKIKQDVAEGSNAGDIELSHSMSPDMLYVHATSDGTDVGGARFKKIDGAWTGDIVHVYPQFRRQGISTKIYDYAEDLVGKIIPSKTLKPKGKKFWDNRDNQGVAEVVNKELWHPERMFKQRVPIGDYEFEARETIGGMGDYDANALTIIVYDPKKKNKIIGNANFVVKGRGSKRSLVSDDTYVDPKYRGEGIATMMYAYAKSLGNDIKGSNIQTPMGKKMWANWGDDAKHLRGVSEDISRRDMLKGMAGVAALGATGAKAGQFIDYDKLIKDPELETVWIPRMQKLQQRCNVMLTKLIRTAGSAWSEQLQGTTIKVESNEQHIQANANERGISIDLTVFWDAPEDVLAFAVGHELGHIALGHTDVSVTPEQSRKDESNADNFAVRLCKALGYNKAGVFKFLYAKKGEIENMNKLTSQPNSTHPTMTQRMDKARQQGFQLSKGGIQQMNTLLTHLA